MSALIRAEHVRIEYGRRAVLTDVSVSVHGGSALAVTGRSGSGKTTLLLALAGLLRPADGTVDCVDPRRVVYVPQAPSLIPELTAIENVALGMRLRGIAPAVAVVRATTELTALGLEDAAEAMPWQLSGGMQQRTALARALALDPLVLLVDEPTGSLDRATGARVLDLLKSRIGAEAALVVATHDETIAARMQRTLHLSDGVLETAA